MTGGATGRARPASSSGIRRAVRRTGSLVGAVLALAAGGVARRPVPVVVALVLATGAFSVGWNALMLQTRKHPAPLFADRSEPLRRVAPEIPLPGIAPPAASAPDPTVPPLPVRRPTAASSATESSPPKAAPLRTAVPLRTGAAGDPIGTLILTGEPPRTGSTTPLGDVARPLDPQRIAAAQSALAQLGYGPLQNDGVLGAGTRAAIERFERDRNLPVSGVLAGRTIRSLAQLSGAALE